MDYLFKEWQELGTPSLKERTIPMLDYRSRKIIAFTGVRRCGKTYLMFQLINRLTKTVPKENVFYLNFEDERIEAKTETLTKLIPSLMGLYGDGDKRYYLFLDEIQIIPEWSRWLVLAYPWTGQGTRRERSQRHRAPDAQARRPRAQNHHARKRDIRLWFAIWMFRGPDKHFPKVLTKRYHLTPTLSRC